MSSPSPVQSDDNTVLDNVYPIYLQGCKRFSQEEITNANLAADYLYYEIGCNVIPANPKVKGKSSIAILKSWTEYQSSSIPIKVFDKWKELGLFAYGIAVVLGNIWRGNNRGYYLNMIDADNGLAIQEICTYEGKTVSLEEFSKFTLIEQHKDNLNKAHFYILSKTPFPIKASDVGKKELGNRIKDNEIPGIEVKNVGGLSFCTNSIHADGHRYEFLHKVNPVHNEEFFLHIGEICKRYGLEYLSDNGKGIGDIPIETLFNPDTVIYEGNNRHKEQLRVNDSLIQRLKDTVPLESIRRYAWIENKRMCKPPLDGREFEKLWNQALGFISQKNKEEKAIEDEINALFEDQNPDLIQQENKTVEQQKQQPPQQDQTEEEINQPVDPEAELLKQKATDEDIENTILAMVKEAQHDRLSVEQLFYGFMSAFTKKVVHHIVNSKDSGAGKSYLIELVALYFPQKYIIPLTGLSAKALFHKKGILVYKDEATGEYKPIKILIDPLEQQLERIEKILAEEQFKDKAERNNKLIKKLKQMTRERQDKIKDIEDNAQKLIDYTNTIFLALDTPDQEVYSALMSVISQDYANIQSPQYTFTDKNSSGKIATTENILRGTPCLNTAQTIDDTGTLRYAEKNRRFVNVNPDTSAAKIAEAKRIIAYRDGFLPAQYDKLLNLSEEERNHVKQTISIVIAKLISQSKKLGPKDPGCFIPFSSSISDAIPNNRVWSMTVMSRLMRYLQVIAKVHMDSRPLIIDLHAGQVYPIAIFADLKKVLELMKVAALSTRPYVINWYNQVFLPSYRAVPEPEKHTDAYGNTLFEEKRRGLNTSQLVEKTNTILGISLGTKEIREKYLYPLLNTGVIDEEEVYDSRSNIYYPVEEGNIFAVLDEAEGNTPRLKLNNNRGFPSKTFLKDQFGTLLECELTAPPKNKKNSSNNFNRNDSIDNQSRFKFVDVDGTEIPLKSLIDKYFNNPEDYFKKVDSDNKGAI